MTGINKWLKVTLFVFCKSDCLAQNCQNGPFLYPKSVFEVLSESVQQVLMKSYLMTDIEKYVKLNFCIFEKWDTFGPKNAKVEKYKTFLFSR